jgi:Putative zinc-finger
MTRSAQCGPVRQALGVYVVGAISPGDRGEVDSHLTSCADCRADLAGLAGLPALLGRVPAAEATGLLQDGGGEHAPPQCQLHSLLRLASRRRRRRLWPGLAVAAAVGLIAGGGAIAASRALESPSRPAAAQQWTSAARGINTITHERAIIRYMPKPWGLELDVQVGGIPVGTRCELQVTTANGQAVASGSWTVTSGHESARYIMSSSVPLSGLRGFTVTSGTQTLVTVPLR